MRLRHLRLFAALILLLAGALVNATPYTQESPEKSAPQEQPDNPAPSPLPAKTEFFSGTITDFDQEHVTVSRSLIGKAPEKRTFLIKPQTKLSRSLKSRSRVTVRYQHLPEGDVALEIQVHPQIRAPRLVG